MKNKLYLKDYTNCPEISVQGKLVATKSEQKSFFFFIKRLNRTNK